MRGTNQYEMNYLGGNIYQQVLQTYNFTKLRKFFPVLSKLKPTYLEYSCQTMTDKGQVGNPRHQTPQEQPVS